MREAGAPTHVDPGAFRGSPDTPEPTDQHVYEAHEQVYETHEQLENEPKDLHHEIGDIIEEACRAEHHGYKHYDRHRQQQPGHYVSPPTSSSKSHGRRIAQNGAESLRMRSPDVHGGGPSLDEDNEGAGARCKGLWWERERRSGRR